MKRGAFAVAALAALLTDPVRARAEAATAPRPVATTRAALVWIFGDDDALNPPNESTPVSPAPSIGDRPGYDPLVSGFRSRYTGRENRIELHFGAAARDLVPSLTTTAELAVGIDVTSFGERAPAARGAPVRAEDLGSFVELRLSLARRSDGGTPVREPLDTEALVLRLYPIDGDLERVGSLEALGWGGAVGPRRESPYAAATGPVRAARLSFEAEALEVFAGVKTAPFVEPVAGGPAIQETNYGFFAGADARPTGLVLVGIGAGYFEHGMVGGSSRRARATTAGASLKVSLQHGMSEPRSPVTFLGPGDDPFRAGRDAPSGAFTLGVEVAALVQRLADFDRPGETTLVPARALAVYGGARLGPFETSAAFLLRDPEFVMRNVPGAFAGSSIPAAAASDIERTLLLSNDLIVSDLVRFDLALGLRFPAAVMTGALDRSGQPTGATLVLHGPGDIALLPIGTGPVPVLDARLALETRLSSLVSAVAWTAYRRDYNRIRPASGVGVEAGGQGFSNPNRLGYGVGARAVW